MLELESDELLAQRSAMIDRQLKQRGIADLGVLAAMRAVPRHHFVPEADRERSYADNALPLGLGQTISQPYMVARAAQLARLSPTDRVLEVGLGSGYQAAVLSRLCRHVTGIELLPELAELARNNLRASAIDNVDVEIGDGSLGFAPAAPYDAIVVAAFATHAPQALLDQLGPGGRLVIPIGNESLQTLTVITRGQFDVDRRAYDSCIYVPLLGAAARS